MYLRKDRGTVAAVLLSGVVFTALLTAFGNEAVADDYYVYGHFNPGVGSLACVGGYVEDYGVPGTWGDEIQFVYFLAGQTGYKVRMWLTDSGDPADPTPYIEPRQHPENPDFPGPIEPRHFEIVSSADLSAWVAGSGSHSEEFQVNSTGVYVGAYPNGIFWFDHDWTFRARIASPPPERTESLAYNAAENIWYAGGRYRTIYQLADTDDDGDFLDEVWQAIFSYPSYGGSHHDGMEYAAGYLWISDMTSDVIGQWDYDQVAGSWVELQRYYYSEPNYVEGMGFGPNNHFWCGSASSVFYEIGGKISGKYPVAVAGEDVPAYPPTIELCLDGSESYHQDLERSIIRYEWDFDGDGSFDYEGSDPVACFAYPAVYNQDGTIDWDQTERDYPAVLRVTDNTPPEDGGPLDDEDSLIVHITRPPWKPVADPGGPYNTRINHDLVLDGSGSYHPAAQMYPPGHPWYDEIVSWDWDLDNDGEFDDASGETVTGRWDTEGTYFVGLRVTDAVPSGQGGEYTDMDMDEKYTTVIIGSIHDIAVTGLVPSASQIMIGDLLAVTVAVKNPGDYSEGPFDVTLTHDGEFIETQAVPYLDPGYDTELEFTWDTTGLEEGEVVLRACAEVVPGEIIVDNNCLETTVNLSHGVFLSIARDWYVDGDPPIYVHQGDVLRKELDGPEQEKILAGRDHLIHTMDALSVLDGGDIIFSMADDGYVRGGGAEVYLTHDDLGRIDAETGEVSRFLDGAQYGIGSIDAVAVIPSNEILFSTARDGYAGIGRGRVYLTQRDLGLLNMSTGEIRRFMRGADYGLWSLDAVELIAPGQILFSLSRDQYFYWWGVFLEERDVGLLDLATGEVSLWLDGRAERLPSIDALSK